MSSAEYVEFDVAKVKGKGWTAAENAAWSELVRSLSSFSRTVVKHLSADKTLLQYLEDGFADAQRTVDAELHFDDVCAQAQSASAAVRENSKGEKFARKAARIIAAKSKRIKQHARRRDARACRSGIKKVQREAEWPPAIMKTAEEFSGWSHDLFMHVSMLVISAYLESKGLLVNRVDNSRTKPQQKKIKSQIHFHGDSIGVQKFELKGFAYLSRATGLLVKPSEADQSSQL